MKSFVKYISKYFVSFSIFIFILIVLNVIAFVGTFYGAITSDYGDTSPRNMLEKTAENCSINGIADEIKAELQSQEIWIMFLTPNGDCAWTVDLPAELPDQYNVQDVAVFSRGYLKDYPVFVWDAGDGLLVLGYPKGTYTKITSNYYSAAILKTIPFYFVGILILDLLMLFGSYYLSKMKMVKDTEPLISSIEALSDGKPVSLSVTGELSEVSSSVNKVSKMLSRQNEARANWISGVSHDIRTPLSMIMGYAGRIVNDDSVSGTIRDQAKIVQRQSLKIKELVQDLNLVSKLEYEMQPLHKETIRLAKLLRSYVAELLNAGIPETHSLGIEISPNVENVVLNCDTRLISRAVNNVVQNSISHNPQGCNIQLLLDCSDTSIYLSVVDDGIGLAPEKLKELEEKPHYMESTDEQLNLRHGLGLVLVWKITEAHDGTMKIESRPLQGCRIILVFPININYRKNCINEQDLNAQQVNEIF